MTFPGFDKQDFHTFLIDGLDARMTAIQEKIQPKFQVIGKELTDDLSVKIGSEMFLHIARHARRTVNPPKDTWLAISNNKRGYKQHPHFQLGLFDDHLFIWLAFIYELPNKALIAENFLNHIDKVKQTVPKDFVVSLDHTKKESKSVSDLDWLAALQRFRDIKKAEFLVGRHVDFDDPLATDGDRLVDFTKQTFATLLPLYHLAFQ